MCNDCKYLFYRILRIVICKVFLRIYVSIAGNVTPSVRVIWAPETDSHFNNSQQNGRRRKSPKLISSKGCDREQTRSIAFRCVGSYFNKFTCSLPKRPAGSILQADSTKTASPTHPQKDINHPSSIRLQQKILYNNYIKTLKKI